MPKSRNRKDHKKRLEKRNERIKQEYQRATKEAWKTFEKMKQEKLSKEGDNIDGINFDFK